MRNFEVSYHTDVGIKKHTNQDSILIKAAEVDGHEILLAAVCDGMGGMQKGELASATVARELSFWFENYFVMSGKEMTEKSFGQEMMKLLNILNTKLVNYGIEHNVQLGTTVTVLLIKDDGTYYICHVGDSRAYLIRNTIEQITEDHTFVEREIKKGNMTREASFKDSRRNVLLQCVGVDEYIKPQFLYGRVDGNTNFLLCSDGFRHEINENEIYENLKNLEYVDVDGIKDALIRLTNMSKERGEQDNISSLFVKYK